MKTKDIDWYDKKLQSIKKRKRKVHLIQEPNVRKRIKADLKREQRGAKRAERRNINIYIEKEIENYYERFEE
jgi:hypothetical protein